MSGRKMLGLLLPLVLLFGCLGDPSLTPKAIHKPAATSGYVGSAACKSCHSDIAALHEKTPHARSLFALTKPPVPTLLPPSGPIAKTGFQLTHTETGYTVTLPSQSDQTAPLTLAVGSGKTGCTYVAFTDDGRMAEFRQSFFPSKQAWYITPGQEHLSPDSLGKVHSQANARRCMSCHAVTLPEKESVPEARFFGVGCESCHGPGGAHVADFQSAAGKMTALSKLPASKLTLLCGKCHGTKTDVEAAKLPKTVTNRMQAYGLMESKCYQKSPERLSCLTCHSPHTAVEKRPASYEAVCLSCHQAPKVTCSVNPKTQCLSCHMPSRKALDGSDIPLTMADHRIHR